MNRMQLQKPVLAIYTTTFKVLVQEIKTASRPLCAADSSLKSGIQRRQDLAKRDYGDKSQALVMGCHRYAGCPTGQRTTENKNVILILSITGQI